MSLLLNNSTNSDNEGLTFEKILETVNQLSPEKTVLAFTVNPRTYELYQQNSYDYKKCQDTFGEALLAHIVVYKVVGQTEDVIEWTDREALKEYLEETNDEIK